MFSYKDRTWCNARCGNEACYRNLTDTHKYAATQWWGSRNFPVAVSNFLDTKECQDAGGWQPPKNGHKP